jgi:hypothetical protein
MSDADRRAAARANAAGPRTVAALHGALKARLESVAAGFSLETKVEGAPRAPTVIDGWLPPKTGDDVDSSRFPFLLVRPRSGVDTQQAGDESATASVQIIIGTYSDEVDGWLDVMMLIDAIRVDLGAEPAIQGTAFEHVGPLSWELQEQQPRPQWFGSVTTQWNLPRPRRVEARNPTEA